MIDSFLTPPPYSTTVYKVKNDIVQLFTKLGRQTKKNDFAKLHQAKPIP